MGEIYVYVDNARMGIVGTNIKELRKAIGYSSVFKFAAAVGLPEKRIDAWERGSGNPKVDDTIKIAKFFGIELQVLREKELTEDQIKSIAQKLVGPFKMNFNNQHPYKKPGELVMNDLILLSIEQLYKLQSEQEDAATVKAIAQVIAYKQYAEGLKARNDDLRREIETLKDFIEHLKTKK